MIDSSLNQGGVMSFLKNMFQPVDMTTGRPWEKILLFTFPMIIGNIAQQLYSTVDSIVVGQYVGDNALAAVGSASPIVNLLLVLFIGISTGASIMVSQYIGAKSPEDLSKTIGSCITLTAISTVIIMIVACFVVRPLLTLLNTPASIYEWSYQYLIISMMGVGGLAFYNILCGVLRGLGDSFAALVYLLVATVLNILLDIWFVAGFGLGVAGVALATAIAQFISAILCVHKILNKKDLYTIHWDDLKLSKIHAGQIIKLGIPSGLTQVIFSLAMVIVQSLTNSFGEAFIAVNVIVMRVDGFAMMPNMSFGNAMTAYAGQNIGAKDYDRLHKGTVSGTLLALFTSILITLTLLLFGKNLMQLFTSTTQIIEDGITMLRYLALGYIAYSITQCLSGVMRGAGDTMTPMWISLITTVIIRVPLAYIMVEMTKSAELPNGLQDVMFISLLISWLLGSLFTYIAYRMGHWRKKIEGFH